MMPHRMFVERYRRFVRDGALPVPRKVVFPPEAAVWRECAELVVGLMPTNPEHLQVGAPRCSLHALARVDGARTVFMLLCSRAFGFPSTRVRLNCLKASNSNHLTQVLLCSVDHA